MDHPLRGSWSATRWQHSSLRDPGRSLDVVCDLGGSVTLSIGEEAFVLTTTGAQRGAVNMDGAFRMRGDTLELHAHEGGASWRVRWHLVEHTLTLSSDESRCDFEGDGSAEPAALVSVFVRL